VNQYEGLPDIGALDAKLNTGKVDDRRGSRDRRLPETCKWCRQSIIENVSRVWVLLTSADLAGYCPKNPNDERHQPEKS